MSDYKSEISKVINHIKTHNPKYDSLKDLLDLCIWQLKDNPDDKDYCFKYSKYIKDCAMQLHINTADERFGELYWKTVLFESPYLFESFIYYMEKNRSPSKKFYEPRKKTLHIVVQDLQNLEDRKEDRKFYGLSMPSRVGKSTICIFFLAWIAMKRPNSHSAMGGHSGILAKGFYKELLNLMTTPEYTFKEIFDYVHPEYADKPFPTDKSADEFTITLGDPDRFATITCRGIDGTWTGAIDVSEDGYLYVDDLVRDRQHSLSPRRMEETFQEYLNKMVDRKNDGARELMVGTLWSIYDPLQRIRIQNENNSAYNFRKIPALNEKDESNFDYEISGFSTQYYKEMMERLDKAEWMAKFMQQPFVREGLVFPIEELRTFDNDNVLPDGNYKVVAVCDPAFGGGDSLSMPICAEHENGKKYIIDWIFNKGTQAVTVPLIIKKIIEHDILEVVLEKNAGGNLLRDIIEEKLKEEGHNHCKISTKVAPNKISKEDKIVAYSDYVKANFIFLLPTHELPNDDVLRRYKRSEEYTKAIEELSLYTSEGKNLHDDSADSMAQLAILFEKKARKPTIIMPSPI